MLLQCPNFFSFAHLHPGSPFPPEILVLSSCPWVMHVSSSAAPLPILFLTSTYFVSTNFCLNPAPFLLFSSFPLPADNPPNGLHIYDSVSILLVCLVCYLDSIINNCEFIAILIAHCFGLFHFLFIIHNFV